MKKNIKKLVCSVFLLLPFYTLFAQDIPEEFDSNTTDVAPISDLLPLMAITALIIAFVFFRKRKTVQ